MVDWQCETSGFDGGGCATALGAPSTDHYVLYTRLIRKMLLFEDTTPALEAVDS